MKTKALYLTDCYLQEFDAKVESITKGKYVVLDQTAFYPNMGGQPNDTGVMIRKNDEKEFRVIFVGKFDSLISHEISGEEELKIGDEVHCKIDWDRRYTLMRYHTAAHVFTKVIYNETGAVISGNQLGTDKSRFDFTLENFDKESVQKWIDKTNEVIQTKKEVKIEFIPREEALKMEDFVRTYKDLIPQGIDILRVINIDRFDYQACGGTHLKNIGEIGKIELVKIENKGKNNRRIYFKLVD